MEKAIKHQENNVCSKTPESIGLTAVILISKCHPF